MGQRHTGGGQAARADGRSTVYGQKKRNRNISITPQGWVGLQAVARLNNCSSVSELIEKVGREEIQTIAPNHNNASGDQGSANQTAAGKDIKSTLEDLVPRALEKALQEHMPRELDRALSRDLPQALSRDLPQALSECAPIVRTAVEQQIYAAVQDSLRPYWSSKAIPERTLDSRRTSLPHRSHSDSPNSSCDSSDLRGESNCWHSNEHY
jgi:hypothetical protein